MRRKVPIVASFSVSTLQGIDLILTTVERMPVKYYHCEVVVLRRGPAVGVREHDAIRNLSRLHFLGRPGGCDYSSWFPSLSIAEVLLYTVPQVWHGNRGTCRVFDAH